MATEIDDAFNLVYATVTAQRVWNNLNELELKRTARHTRWIWELLQNAHDASTSTDSNLIVKIKYKQGELVFLHNGCSFKAKEIAHLIGSGSTKDEEENTETIGQYGTGFLTTHLLSLKIDISGQLDNDQWFDFTLARNMDSQEALFESMSQAQEDFKNSLSCQKPSIPTPFTTQFVYPIEGKAEEAVDAGINMLKQCAPLVVVFNQKFCCIEIDIDIEARREKLCFEVLEPGPLDENQIQQITVAEGNSRERKYLLAHGKTASVTIPLESNNNQPECLLVGKIPRIFLGLPLVGTESFSFPATVNSFDFSTIPDRDGVPLGRSNNEKNRDNQVIIEEAYMLLVRMLRYAVSFNWHHVHLLAEVPTIPEKDLLDWLDTDWLRGCIKEKLIDQIRQTPTIVTEVGAAMAPKDATLLLAENIKDLWDLLEGLKGQRKKLPRREEAAGWRNAIRSWAAVFGDKPESLFSEVMDGRKLASYIHEKTRKGNTYGKIENLQGLLREDVSAVEWLNQLHKFFNENGLRDVRSEYHIVIDQDGFLDLLSNLHCDRGIDEELKDIAELLGWSIRQELRDTRLTSLAKEVGKGGRENKDILGDLISELREHAKDPDGNFKEASARLFAWIVDQEDWERLRGFPVFAKDGNSILDLPTAHGDDPPLAPVHAWSEDLKQFIDLFPPDRILAEDFKVCAPEAWEQLDQQSLIRKSMIITRNETDLKTLSPDINQDEGTHETDHGITVTDIVEWQAVMKRVSNRWERGFLLWRFLTEWLIKEYGQDLEIQETLCTTCKETHEYYTAAWLMPVRNRNWIRLEASDKRVRADTQSLARLLRNNGWESGSLSKNPAAIELLKAISVERFDLMRQLAAEDDDARVVMDNAFIDMLSTVEGEVTYLNRAREYIEDLKNDEDLPDVLEKRRKQRKRVYENQHLGKRVEQLVEKSLEETSFVVNRKPIGSDFEIEHDLVENDEEMGIELSQGDESWLIEVKATRREEVQMTSTQAKTAVDEKNRFLLCVVPLDPGDTDPELETVRTKIRFIKNIGSLVDQLCDDLDNLEEFREEITAEALSGVQLEVRSGTARIRVTSPVWENDGFPLANLVKQLK